MADVAFENKIEDLEHIAIFGFDGNLNKTVIPDFGVDF